MKAEKPASRQEALTRCLAGCIKRVEQARPPWYKEGRTCERLCGCIVGDMFDANGEPRKDPKLPPEVATACGERLARELTQPSGPTTTDEPRAK